MALDQVALPVFVLDRQKLAGPGFVPGGPGLSGSVELLPTREVASPGIEPGVRPYESQLSTNQPAGRIFKCQASRFFPDV